MATQPFPNAQLLAGSRGSITEEAQPFSGETGSPPDEGMQVLSSAMTLADFVAKVFVPEHVMERKLAGQTHYRAMLKHVLTPERVDSFFHASSEASRLRAVPNWPYMDNVRLCDVGPDNIRHLISAAYANGYSAQTAAHIRNVVKAIFTAAIRRHCFGGENPASIVRLPKISREERHVLSLSQVKQLLGVMQYPEREMALMAMLTDLNMAEICSLRWKHVNLREESLRRDEGIIPPKSIVVAAEKNELEAAKTSWNRSVPIPEPLFAALRQMRSRPQFTGDEDLVLVSRRGGPIRPREIAVRRLKRIGTKVGMPWLSWRVFHRCHTTLTYELGMHLLEARCGRPAFNRAEAFMSDALFREEDSSAPDSPHNLSSRRLAATPAAGVAKIQADLKDLGNKLRALALELNGEGLQSLHKSAQFELSGGVLAELIEELGSVRERLAQTECLLNSTRKLAIPPPTDAFLRRGRLA